MKRIIKCIIIIFSIFILLGCKTDVDKLVRIKKEEVSKKILDRRKISKDKITESVDFIIDNTNINGDFVYHTLFLKNITSNKYLNDTKIYELAIKADSYMLKQTDNSKRELEDISSYIKKNEHDIIKDFYNKYENYFISSTKLGESKTKLLVEMETKGAINSSKINKAIDYILLNYKNPFKNEEVLEKTIYYAMYLDTVGTKNNVNNDVVEIGKNMKKYIQELDDKYIDKITELKSSIKQNRDSLVDQIVNPPKKD